jgi:hypothetical protein
VVKSPPSVARSTTADLASYGTIAGKLRFVPDMALIGSEPVRRPTASGYSALERLNNTPVVHSFLEARHEIHPGQWPNALRSTYLRDVRNSDFSSYLREIWTHLTYCNHDCYAEHCNSAIRLLESRAKVS